MAVSNVLLLAQATGYLVAFMLSLCTLVPMALHMQCFRGQCLLFASGQFGDDGNFTAVWASRGYCIYCAITGCLLLLASAVQTVRLFAFLRRGIDSSFLSAFLECILTLVLTIFVFVASILVTLGFRKWCDAIVQRFSSCDDASVMEIDKVDQIHTKGFYLQIGTVQFGVWSSWVFWVLLTVLSVLKLCRYHEREVMKVSMARQRQKIMRHQYEQPVESADE